MSSVCNLTATGKVAIFVLIHIMSCAKMGSLLQYAQSPAKSWHPCQRRLPTSADLEQGDWTLTWMAGDCLTISGTSDDAPVLLPTAAGSVLTKYPAILQHASGFDIMMVRDLSGDERGHG